MSKQYKVTFTDAIADALEQQALREGQGERVQATIKRAVRYWLSKSGHDAATLDLTDKAYVQTFGSRLEALPRTRLGADGN